MRATKTLLDYMAEDCWTIRIPKPRISRATVRWTAALALSLGFNVGFLYEAHGAEAVDPCQASAELHWHMSGGDDAAYEDSLEACHVGMTFAEFRSLELPMTAEEAGRLAMACETETAWAERVEGGWVPVCGDADGNPVGAP